MERNSLKRHRYGTIITIFLARFIARLTCLHRLNDGLCNFVKIVATHRCARAINARHAWHPLIIKQRVRVDYLIVGTASRKIHFSILSYG